MTPLASAGEERWALRGKTGLLLALAGGGGAALAHPPFDIWPGILGYGLLLQALDAAPTRRPLLTAFLRGWAAGFGYLLIGTWWIAEAFFVDAATHGWQAPFAVLFTAGGISVFWGGAGLAYRLIAPRGAWRVLVFAATLSGFEWLRGHVLTGFPWDLPGECWRAGSAMSQAACLVGAYGMSLLTIAIGAGLGMVWRKGAPSARIMPPALAALALLGLWGFGALRLSQPGLADTPLRLRIVQPDLDEQQSDLALRFERFALLTSAPTSKRADVVIWPEGALPASFNDLLAPGAWTRTALQQLLSPGQILLIGGVRAVEAPGRPVYYNSLLALRRTPTGLPPLGFYDKHRLVPFGEFMPAPRLFQILGVASLVQNGVPFTPGPRPAPVRIAGLPLVQPLICYESLFPSLPSHRGGRPAWIVNISDDAWFGRTTGPLQHLNLASYRAIEQGVPVVRSTPTGVSAIIDSYGRVRQSLGLGRAGTIDGQLPAALGPTLYSRLGDLTFYVLLAVLLSPALILRLTRSVVSRR